MLPKVIFCNKRLVQRSKIYPKSLYILVYLNTSTSNLLEDQLE